MSSVPERGLLWRVTLATAVAIAVVGLLGALAGAHLSARASMKGIERRAAVLASMVRARLNESPAERHAEVVTRMQARIGGVVTLVDRDGRALADAPTPTDWSRRLVEPGDRQGQVTWNDRTYYVIVMPVAGTINRLVVAVPVTSSRGAVVELLIDVFTVLLTLGALGVAAALIVARDIVTDVRAITRRALQMASREPAAALEPLPVRALDEVGELVAAFNRLQRRFAEELDAHRAAIARLEDAERRKEALIATLRHELRTPLNAIIGFAELLLSGVDGELSDAQREDVEVIARSGKHLLNLVDDVLDLSAIASGRFVVEMRPVDLVALSREIARETEGQARPRGISIAVSGVPHAIAEGDVVSLRRAITNLVQNAIQYARSNVSIVVDLMGRDATVAVTDDGPGIRPADIKRLFKPFERGRTGESTRAGAGLGLAITVALVELHGGTLRAESELGQGSTFTVTLPLRPTALAQAGFE